MINVLFSASTKLLFFNGHAMNCIASIIGELMRIVSISEFISH